MYADIPHDADLCQGDIIENVVFGYVSIFDPPLYNEDGQRVDFDPQQLLTLEDELDVMVAAQKSRVMILSQDCDCLSKPYICVARIVVLQEFDRDYANRIAAAAAARNIAKYIHDQYQRAGAKPDAFYIQENDIAGIPKSVVAFTQLHSIETSDDNIRYLKNHRIARLEPQAVLDLQFRIAFYFGRFATEDDYMLTEAERDALTPPQREQGQPAQAAAIPPNE